MRYLVRARVRPDCGQPLLTAIENRTPGRGSVAERGSAIPRRNRPDARCSRSLPRARLVHCFAIPHDF